MNAPAELRSGAVSGLGAVMQTFLASDCVNLAKEVGRLSEFLTKSVPADDYRLEETGKKDTDVITVWRDSFKGMGLTMCVLQCNRMLEAFGHPYTNANLGAMLNELHNRMFDECSMAFCLILTPSESELYNQTEAPFGKEIENKFSDFSEDISEAAKCLALHRSTAAVFHLMRIMEVGVQKFGDKLGIELASEQNWQIILDQINSKIKSMGKANPAKHLAQVASNLYNVKLAWRNETMHPKSTYTDDEAESIFRAVKSFVQDLATAI